MYEKLNNLDATHKQERSEHGFEDWRYVFPVPMRHSNHHHRRDNRICTSGVDWNHIRDYRRLSHRHSCPCEHSQKPTAMVSRRLSDYRRNRT